MKTDVTLNLGSFADTSAKVVAVSDKARELFAQMFGAGAVSAELPKSRAADFAVFCQQKGMTVA